MDALSSNGASSGNSKRNFHCTGCQVVFMTYDEVREHVRQFHLQGTAEKPPPAPAVKRPSTGLNLLSLLTSTDEESPPSTSADQDRVKKIRLSSEEAENDNKEGGSEVVSPPAETNVVSEFSNVTYEMDEHGAASHDEIKVMKILASENVITDDLLLVYEKEDEVLGGEIRLPNVQLQQAETDSKESDGQLSSDKLMMDSQLPSTYSVNTGYGSNLLFTPFPYFRNPSERSEKEPGGSIEIPHADKYHDEFIEDDESLSPEKDKALFESPVRTTYSAEDLCGTWCRSRLEYHFGEYKYKQLYNDPYFHYLWQKTFEKKGKDLWNNNKLTDVIDVHEWTRRK